MNSPKNFYAQGIPVEYSFYSDHEPYILNGTFEIENKSELTLQFSIHQVWCQVLDRRMPIAQFFVYRLPGFEEEDPLTLQQPPNTTVQYEVSFPQIPAVPYLNEQIQIGIELEISGEMITVLSPYQISRRTKRTSYQ